MENTIYKWMIWGYPSFWKPPSATNPMIHPKNVVYTMVNVNRHKPEVIVAHYFIRPPNAQIHKPTRVSVEWCREGTIDDSLVGENKTNQICLVHSEVIFTRVLTHIFSVFDLVSCETGTSILLAAVEMPTQNKQNRKWFQGMGQNMSKHVKTYSYHILGNIQKYPEK